MNNPLMKHFRQPALYLPLPSKGQYWVEGSLEMPISNEIPVYPMTTKDEIILRTPDALLNGESVVNVIQSCCPNIKDAWKAPSIDVDAILIAIRIASYGTDMEIESNCIHCNHRNNHTIDLNYVLDRTGVPDYKEKLHVDGLQIKFKPQQYFEINKTNLVNFQEQRILQTINNDNLTEEVKLAEFKNHLQRLIDLNTEIIASSIESITVDTGEVVTEKQYINEFLQNCDGKIVKHIQTKLEEIAEKAALPKVKVSCESCEKEYDVSITFDYSSFFVQGS